jgi:hypothetical protein
MKVENPARGCDPNLHRSHLTSVSTKVFWDPRRLFPAPVPCVFLWSQRPSQPPVGVANELVSDALPLMLGFELADHSLGLVVEGGDDLVGVLFRVVESQAADREIDEFMTVPRSRPG